MSDADVEVRESGEKVRKRAGKACVRCRAGKAKCDGNAVDPCTRCRQSALDCVYVPTQRGRRPGVKNMKTRERERLQSEAATASQPPHQHQHMSPPRDAELLVALSQYGGYSSQQPPSSAFRASVGQPYDVSSHVSLFQQGSSRDHAPALTGAGSNGAGALSGTITPLDPANVVMDAHLLNSRILSHYNSNFPVAAAAASSTSPSGHTGGSVRPAAVVAAKASPLETNSPHSRKDGLDGSRDDRAPGPIQTLAASITSKIFPHDPAAYPPSSRLWACADTFEPKPSAKPATSIRPDLISGHHWTEEDGVQALRQQREYFAHGVLASKLDVGTNLEPTHRGIVSEADVDTYFAAFAVAINPQIGLFDPALFAASEIRAKSAYLFTVILALGAMACPSAPLDHITKLFEHAGKLEVVLFGTHAKSLEIVQGKLLHAFWGLPSSREVDDRISCRLGQAHRMGIELGLNQSKHHVDNDEISHRLARTRERTWMRVCVVDHHFSRFNGRTSFGATDEIVTDVRAWSQSPFATHGDRMVGALWELHLIEKEAYETMAKNKGSAVRLESNRATLNIAVEAWFQEWAPSTTEQLSIWTLRFQGILTKLIFTRVVLGHFPPSSTFLKPCHEDLLELAQTALTLALELLPTWRRVIPRSISGTITYAGALLVSTPAHHNLMRAVAHGFVGTRESRAVFDFSHHNGNFLHAMLQKPPTPQEEPVLSNWFEDAMLDSWPIGDLFPLAGLSDEDTIPSEWVSAWPPADGRWTDAFNSVLG